MSAKRAYAYIGVGVGLLIVLVVAIVAWVVIRTQRGSSKSSSEETKLSTDPATPIGSDFYIYNYLNKPVRIDLVSPKSKIPVPFIEAIPARQRRGLKMSTVIKHFRDGASFRIYILNVPGESQPVHFSDYSLDLPQGATIRALHVGMVTSRWVGATQDYKFIPALNAVQGRPWIKIHNRTALNLHINEGIDISPYGILRYSGRDHFGVRIGTIFTDQQGIFPPWKFTTPATDVYWGVVSDLQQPLFGGWQIDSEFDDEADNPQWLLENGWYGGPAHGNISPGFIPKDGPPTAPLDRWGQLPKLPKKW